MNHPTLEQGRIAYYNGDYKRAHEIFFSLAEKGGPKAMNNLGVMHELGHGVPQSVEEARKWYQMAADQGLELAEQNMERIENIFEEKGEVRGKGFPKLFWVVYCVILFIILLVDYFMDFLPGLGIVSEEATVSGARAKAIFATLITFPVSVAVVAFIRLLQGRGNGSPFEKS